MSLIYDSLKLGHGIASECSGIEEPRCACQHVIASFLCWENCHVGSKNFGIGCNHELALTFTKYMIIANLTQNGTTAAAGGGGDRGHAFSHASYIFLSPHCHLLDIADDGDDSVNHDSCFRDTG